MRKIKKSCVFTCLGISSLIFLSSCGTNTKNQKLKNNELQKQTAVNQKPWEQNAKRKSLNDYLYPSQFKFQVGPSRPV